MPLDAEQLELLLSVSRDACLGTSFPERMEAVGATLLSLVPGCALTVIVLDPERPTADLDAYVHNGSPGGPERYAAHYARHDPLPALLEREEGAPSLLSDAVAGGRWGRDPYTGEFLPGEGIRHVIGFHTTLTDGRRLQLGVHREPSRRDFSRAEQRLLGLASEDIGRAAEFSLARARMARLVLVFDEDARVGLVVVNASGEVEHVDRGARGILGRFGEASPLQFVTAVARAAAVQPAGRCARAFAVEDDEVLCIRAQAVSPEAWSWVWVVLEVRSPLAAEDFSARIAPYRLTARECDVARWAVAGLTNPEIACRLRIRVPTVAAHLSHVFRKVQVSGRTELARRLGPSAGRG